MKPRQPQPRVVQDDEARRMLREDYPPAVKAALLLAMKGGRVPKGCLLCGKRGAIMKRKVWIPDDVLAIERQTTERPRLYLLCPACEATAPSVAVVSARLMRKK